MFDFNYFAPTEVCFGKDSLSKLGELLNRNNAKKVLVHYGQNSVIKSGLLDKVKGILDDNCINYVLLGGVVPNPRLSLVYKGIDLCKEENVDFILAVGGGSVIDSAKAIAYGMKNDGDVWDFYAHTRKPLASMPIGCVVTIAAAGSEMSDSSVITNDKTKEKRGCNSDLCRPKFAIMDPTLTLTLPNYQTACGCVDIMMHTQERYFTAGKNMELTDAIAEGLMKTVMKNALILKDDPKNYDARAEIMWASSLSHNGLTGCGNGGNDFASHALEHELSGMFDVAHGAGLAAIWPSWARYVYRNCLPRFKKFAINVMNIEDKGNDLEIALKGIEAVEHFYREINMPTNFKELGINLTEEQMISLAKSCSRATGGHRGSAKVLYEEDMLNIYRRANEWI